MQAQATRTWVSGVGDDVNPCSRTAPCKTFAGAISKTAAGGIINVLDPGGYGAVTITKAITIDGGGYLAGILAAGTNGVVVNAGNGDVVRLVGLDIEGVNQTASPGLNGVRFVKGAHLIIENCRIFGFSQAGLDVQPSDNLTHLVTVKESSFDSNTVGGILLKPAGTTRVRATLTRVRMSKNGFGIRVQDGAAAAVSESVVSDSGGNGFDVISAAEAAELNLVDSVAANNRGGVASTGVLSQGPAALARIADVTVFNNSVGLSATSGGRLLSFCVNYNAGNTVNGLPTGTIPPPCPYILHLPLVGK